MDTSSIDYSKVKKIAFIVAVFFVAVWAYSSVKSYFQHYFSSIEKRQEEIMTELKTIKAENRIVTAENTPFSLIQEVGKMKEEIAKLKEEVSNKDDILRLLNTVPTSTPSLTKKESSSINFVTISNNKWQTVDVFAEKNSSSKIVGQAIYNKSYPYTKKENGYYYIALSDNIYGWIHSQFVKEY